MSQREAEAIGLVTTLEHTPGGDLREIVLDISSAQIEDVEVRCWLRRSLGVERHLDRDIQEPSG